MTMPMKRTMLLALLLLSATAHAGWKVAEPGTVASASGGAFSVQPPPGWVYDTGSRHVVAARNGTFLDGLNVTLVPHKNAFKALKKPSTPESLPEDLAGYHSYKVRGLPPGPICTAKLPFPFPAVPVTLIAPPLPTMAAPMLTTDTPWLLPPMLAPPVPTTVSVATPPALTPHPGEVEDVFWVALADLVADGVHRTERWVRGELDWLVEFFDLPHDTIWGATARMLVELLAVQEVSDTS